MSRPILSQEAKDTVEMLKRYAEPPPPGRGFWALTPEGIVRRDLPPGVTTPALMGYVRTPTYFWPRNPFTGELLQRIRLWVPEGATDQDIAKWIEPYRYPRPEPLMMVVPLEYDLQIRQPAYTVRRTPGVTEYEWSVTPGVEAHLKEIVDHMNDLPYTGYWKLYPLPDGGWGIMSVKGLRPRIVFNPKDGRFYVPQSDFDTYPIEQAQTSAAIVLKMLAQNFPEYFQYTRHRKNLPPDVAQALRRKALREYMEKEELERRFGTGGGP